MDAGGHHIPLTHDYWCAYLAASIGGALVTEPFEHAKPALKQALADFTKSRACSAEVRTLIRKGGTAS